MADEESTKPSVSDLAAQLAAQMGNKPLTPAAGSAPQAGQPEREQRPPRENRPQREGRPPREGRGEGGRPEGARPQGDRGGRPEGRPQSDRGGRPEGRPGGDRGPRPGGGRDFQDIDLDKLINDSLYLDNQAHAVVVRIRDMDSGTRSTLRRLYNSVRRATRAAENERQHEFVMLRARLAYTIARHGLRSLDQIERLLLQVTRKNEARGYERFRDLFEAIVAYNE
ncbi:MAG TPA: type III-A CRISPR-associated protein Csm2 [Bryobacteraceae bacterium]|nr:type III-A CRISPR-associated protein Csm2 [Bryobacteraceae bacterium]